MAWPARLLVCLTLGLAICWGLAVGAGCGGSGPARPVPAPDQPEAAAAHAAPGIRVQVMRFAGDQGPAFARALTDALAEEIAQAAHRRPDGSPAAAVQVMYGGTQDDDAGGADVVIRGSARRQGRGVAVRVDITFTHAHRLGAPDRMWSSEVLRVDSMPGGVPNAPGGAPGSDAGGDADDGGDNALQRRARDMAAYLAGLSYYQDLVHEGNGAWTRAAHHLARASESRAPAVVRRARLLLFHCHERTGAWPRAEQVARQTVQDGEDTGDPRWTAQGLYMQAILAKKSWRLDEAIALARRSMDLMRADAAAPDDHARAGEHDPGAGTRASARHRDDARRALAVATGLIADVHHRKGELDQALRIFGEQVLPAFAALGDARAGAMVQGLMAGIHQERGDLDLALRIRRDEELPIYDQLGDHALHAVTLGQIADIHQARGELDLALRIRRDQVLPAFAALGDLRAHAITLGQIADIHQERGELDLALRIHRDQELPVYERLGEPALRAATLGQIADIHQERGELDLALRIHRDQVLPIYDQLDDARALAIARTNLAQVLLEREAPGDRAEAARLLRAALDTAETMALPEAAHIRAILDDGDLRDEP